MFCSKCGKENADESKFCKFCGNQLGTQAGQSSPLQTESLKAASSTRRFIHFVVDYYFARYLFAGLVFFITLELFDENAAIILGIIALFFYHLFFEYTFQRTLGKMLTGTKVVTLSGEKPGFLSLLGRTLARYIPLEPLSYLVYGSNPTKGWHDRLSHTLVVRNDMTPTQVKSINQNQTEGGASWLIIIVGAFFMISIIGILAAVVLASLNDARDAGRDASTKQTLSNLRSQAEIYYNKNNYSYEGYCEDSSTKLLAASFDSELGDFVCYDSSIAFAASAKLINGTHQCIDSTGSNTEITIHEPYRTLCEDQGRVPGDIKPLSISPEDWITYSSIFDNFNINLPNYPETDSEYDIPTDDPTFTYDLRSYITNDSSGSYYIYSYTYSDPLDLSTPNTILDSILSGLLNGLELNKPSYSNYTTLSGGKALEFKASKEGEDIKGVIVIGN